MAFSQEVADSICRHLADGMSLRAACALDGMPDAATVLRWTKDEGLSDFAQQYARAREIGYTHLADEIIAIADETSHDTIMVGSGDNVREAANGEWISRSKLRVDARKWMLSKMLPKVYGDKLAIGGDSDNPLRVALTSDDGSVL